MRALHLIPLAGLAAGALLSIGCGCNEEPENLVEPTVEDPHDIGQYLSMGVYDGQPAASYYDRTKGGLTFALGEIDGEKVNWTEERIDGFADEEGLDVGDRGKYTSMLIDGDDVWITYFDATNGNLFYALRGGKDDWETGVADTGGGSTPNAGRFSSLAKGADGNPAAAHYDEGKGHLRLTRWNGSGWAGMVIDEGEDYVPADTGTEPMDADVGKYAHLYVDGGTEYIAYYDAANGDLKLASGSGSNFTVEVVASEGDVGTWPSILVSGGEVLIAYQDQTNWDLVLARGTPGGNWSTEVIDDGEFRGADTEIYENGSYPGILYFDGSDNNMMQASFDGSAWTTRVVAEEGGLGFHNETIVIGGTRYAGCYDYSLRTLHFQAL
jgi:hypothetical protein